MGHALDQAYAKARAASDARVEAVIAQSAREKAELERQLALER